MGVPVDSDLVTGIEVVRAAIVFGLYRDWTSGLPSDGARVLNHVGCVPLNAMIAVPGCYPQTELSTAFTSEVRPTPERNHDFQALGLSPTPYSGPV